MFKLASQPNLRRSERIKSKNYTQAEIEELSSSEQNNTRSAAPSRVVSDIDDTLTIISETAITELRSEIVDNSNTSTAAVNMAEDGDQNAQAEQTQAMRRRNFYENNIRRQDDQLKCEMIAAMTRIEVEDAIKRLNETFDKYELENLSVVSDAPPETAQAEFNKYAEVEGIFRTLIGTLRAKQDEFMQTDEAERRQNAAGIGENRPLQVTIEAPDVMGSIKEVWGTFHGDHSKWREFRDLFKANAHDNNKLQPIHKFQLLKRALKAEALRVVGSMLTTELNYQKAWEHLCQKYDDDYLAVKEITKRLLAVRPLEHPSYEVLRAFLDTMHECINQLGAYFDINTWDPLLVFIIVDRFDESLFGKWEKVRLEFKEQATAEAARGAAEARTCTVPPLAKLMEFLETRVRILMHKQKHSAENDNAPLNSRDSSRSRDSSGNRDSNRNRDTGRNYDSNRSYDPNGNRERNQHPLAWTGAIPKTSRPTGANASSAAPMAYPPCVIENCRLNHALYRCPHFSRMSLVERESIVDRNRLCKICLKCHGPGECRQIRKDCDKCNVENLAHNSLLCKTREVEKRTSMMSIVGNNPEPLSMNTHLRTQTRWKHGDGHGSGNSRNNA